jgi:hypothetical protein
MSYLNKDVPSWRRTSINACSHCGKNSAEVYVDKDEVSSSGFVYFVKCEVCRSQGPVSNVSPEESIRLWNRKV